VTVFLILAGYPSTHFPASKFNVKVDEDAAKRGGLPRGVEVAREDRALFLLYLWLPMRPSMLSVQGWLV
jgi:hypothetical protein